MEIVIRKETPADYRETEAMVRRSFFNKHRPRCDEHYMVHIMRGDPLYLPEISRVAEADGHIVGGIFWFRAQIDTGASRIDVASFGPLCAEHRYKNRGVGAKLLEETLPLAKAAGFPGVLIMGEPGYYPKRGFERAATFGLTDAEGNVYDPFMGIEFVPGALHIPGGRFLEPEHLCSFPEDAVRAFDEEFEPLLSAYRPCQWTYDNASDEKNGYHTAYAVERPRAFEELYREYRAELAADDAEERIHAIRDDVNKAAYIIRADGENAGLLVTAVAAAGDPDGCGAFLQDICLRLGFRKRGIAKDIFLRFLRQQKEDTGFCVSNGSGTWPMWKALLDRAGYRYTVSAENGGVFCRVYTKEKNGGTEQ